MAGRARISAASRESLRAAFNGDHVLQADVYAKTDSLCWYCGEHFNDWVFIPTIDHVIDLAHGGTNDYDNLVPCCVVCNSIKGDRGVEYLRARLACMEIMWRYEAKDDLADAYTFFGEGRSE